MEDTVIMKKVKSEAVVLFTFFCLLVVISLVAVPKTANAAPNDPAPVAKEFIDKLYAVHYFETLPCYTKTLYDNKMNQTHELDYRLCSERLAGLVEYAPGGLLREEADRANKTVLELFGFGKEDTANSIDYTVTPAQITPVSPEKIIPEYLKLERKTAGSVVYWGNGETCVLDVPGTVCRPIQYKNELFWVIAPNYVDFTFEGDVIYLFDKDGSCRIAVDMVNACEEARRDLFKRPIHTYFAGINGACVPIVLVRPSSSYNEQMESLGELLEDVTYPYYKYDSIYDTSKQEYIDAACALFREYCGYVPRSLEQRESKFVLHQYSNDVRSAATDRGRLGEFKYIGRTTCSFTPYNARVLGLQLNEDNVYFFCAPADSIGFDGIAVTFKFGKDVREVNAEEFIRQMLRENAGYMPIPETHGGFCADSSALLLWGSDGIDAVLRRFEEE